MAVCALMIFRPSQSKINLNENIQFSIYLKINQAPHVMRETSERLDNLFILCYNAKNNATHK